MRYGSHLTQQHATVSRLHSREVLHATVSRLHSREVLHATVSRLHSQEVLHATVSRLHSQDVLHLASNELLLSIHKRSPKLAKTIVEKVDISALNEMQNVCLFFFFMSLSLLFTVAFHGQQQFTRWKKYIIIHKIHEGEVF